MPSKKEAVKVETLEEKLIRRAEVKRVREAKERKGRMIIIPTFLVAFGVPIFLVSSCVYNARNTPQERTHAQGRCSQQGLACDREGYPVGTSEKTKDLLEGKD
jgi:hypothetical protein